MSSIFEKTSSIYNTTNNLRADFMDYIYSDDSIQDAMFVQSILDAASYIDTTVQEIENEINEKQKELAHLKMRIEHLEQKYAKREDAEVCYKIRDSD